MLRVLSTRCVMQLVSVSVAPKSASSAAKNGKQLTEIIIKNGIRTACLPATLVREVVFPEAGVSH